MWSDLWNHLAVIRLITTTLLTRITRRISHRCTLSFRFVLQLIMRRSSHLLGNSGPRVPQNVVIWSCDVITKCTASNKTVTSLIIPVPVSLYCNLIIELVIVIISGADKCCLWRVRVLFLIWIQLQTRGASLKKRNHNTSWHPKIF